MKIPSISSEGFRIEEMTKIYFDEFAFGKHSQSVKSCILRMLGLFSEHFPKYFSEKAQYLIQIILDDLSAQFDSKKPDFQIICGGMAGLNSVLVSFSYIVVDDPKKLQRVFRFVEFVLNPPSGVKSYGLPKSGLKLLETHSSILKAYLTDRHSQIYKYIKKYCIHETNKAIRKYAFHALESFLQAVCDECMNDDRSDAANLNTIKFFVKEFWIGLENSTSILESSVYIRGLGRFSRVVRRILDSSELKTILQKLVSISERMYISGSNGTLIDGEETMEHLPNIITAFSNLFFEIEEIDDVYIDNLEKIIGTFFLVYPQLYEYQRIQNYRAITRLFVSLYTKGTMLQKLLSKITFQGLVLTCSRPQVMDIETTEYYFEYQDLWKNILSPKIPSDIQYFTKDDEKDIVKVIYHEFISCILKITKKIVLDYNVVKKVQAIDAEEKLTGINWDDEDENTDVLKATVPKDFELFLNLVEFCKLILPSTHINHFENWVYFFTKEMIMKSIQYPLVSGFYKLIKIAMGISDEIGYFRDIGESGELKNQNSLQSDGEPNENILSSSIETRRMCFSITSKYIKELIIRLRQYKDELLGSCLQLVLSMPHQFVEVTTYLPCLQIAFKMGLGYLPLSEIGLDAVEYWHEHKKTEFLANLSNILPFMNDFLLMSQRDDDTALNSTNIQETNEYRSEYDSLLKGKIQQRVIKVLSILGGNNIKIIKELDLTGMMAWDEVPRVDIGLPFDPHMYEVFIDDLLPRITDLAENSADRQTKVAACEFLHSIVLFLVGRRAFSKEDYKTINLYKHIFPVIIRLATDVELITRQLFEPLAMQLIHWFTRNTQEENPETMTLLDSIIESVSNEHNGPLRVFCAKCLTEFLKWSIKQSSVQTQKNRPFNAKALFKRLFNLGHHPNPYHRLGCILTFKHLYRVFREEEALVDTFALEITCNLFFTLRLSFKDDESLGTTQICKQVIGYMGKIISHYSGLLSKKNDRRRKFRDLQKYTLWVFQECKRPEPIVRRVAFSHFLTLVEKLPGNPTPAEWMKSKIKESEISEAVISLFERPTKKTPPEDHFSVHDIEKWFDSFSMTLDVYYWIMANDMTTPTELMEGGSKILHYIKRFIRLYAMINTNTVVFNQLLQSEKDRFNNSRCFVITRILKLLVLLFDKYNFFEKIDSLKEVHIYKTISLCLLAPDLVGISPNDAEQNKKIHTLIYKFIQSIKAHSDHTYLDKLNESLKKLFRHKEMNLLACDFTASHIDLEKVRQLVTGYSQLHRSGVFENNFTYPVNVGKDLSKYSKPYQLAEMIISQIYDNTLSYSPAEINLCNMTLKLLFSLLENCDFIYKWLVANEVKIQKDNIDEMGAVVKDKEEIFYLNFRVQIDDLIIKKYDYWIALLMQKVHTNPLCFRIVMNTLENIGSTSKKTVFDAIVHNIPSLTSWISEECKEEVIDRQLEFLTRLLKIDENHIIQNHESIEFVYNVFVAYMGGNRSLKLKKDVLDLLPCLLKVNHPNKEKKIKSLLNTLIIDEFPITSNTVASDTIRYTEYIGCLDRLFESLCISKNVVMLEILFPILKEANHSHIEKIDSYLDRFVRSINDDVLATDIFNTAMDAFMDIRLSGTLRLNIMRKICLPILNAFTVVGLTNLFIRYIDLIANIIKSIIPDKNVKQETVDTAMLTNRIGSLHLVLAMYQKLPLNAIKSEITSSYMKSEKIKGNEITQIIMRSVYSIRDTSAVTYDLVEDQMILDYHRTAYITVSTIIMITQSQEKFFTIFCFNEEPSKGEMIWENIIDIKTELSFEVETNFPIATKELSSLYSQATRKFSDQRQTLPKKYISSNYLIDSSLSQDVAANSPFFVEGNINDSKMAIEKEGEEEIERDVIELDPINASPCMFTILDLIDCMNRKFEVDYKALLEKPIPEMPKWMEALYNKMTSISTHLNIKVFIVKVILNRQSVFAPYMFKWFIPIIEHIVSNEETTGKNGLNYYLRDICISFLKYDFLPTESYQRRLANKFVEFIITRTYHNDRQIVKSNMQIVKLLIEKWSKFIHPNKKIIMEFLTYDKRPRSTRLHRLIGLLTVGYLLSNGFKLYDPEHDNELSKAVWLETLGSQFLFPYKEIYSLAAEVIGYGIKVCDEAESTSLQTLVSEKMSSFIVKEDHMRYLTCIQKVSASFPSFVDPFMHRIASNMKKYNDLNMIALDLLGSRIGHVDEIFDLIKPHIEHLVKHRNEETQMKILDILLHLIPSLSVNQIQYFYTWIFTVNKIHSSENLRSKHYDVLLEICSRHPVFLDYKDMTNVLLTAITDSNSNLSQRALQFWEDSGKLHKDPSERLKQLLSDMYHPDIEKDWLRIVVHLITRASASSQHYLTNFFKPLTDCSFKEQKIDASFNFSTAPMTPLFGSQTQMSLDPNTDAMVFSQSLSDRMDMEEESFTGPRLRETQVPRFSDTFSQAPSASLSASQKNITDTFVEPTPSSQTIEDRSIRQSINNTQYEILENFSQSQQSNIRITKRFVQSTFQREQNYFWKQQALKQRRKKESLLRDENRRRQHQVTIFRNYRKGDLPDVNSLSIKGILEPLLAISWRDEIIARQFLSSIFKSICEKISDFKDLNEIILSVLKKSSYISAPFVYWVLSTSLVCEIEIPPALVASATMKSNNYHLGIAVLEHQIMSKRLKLKVDKRPEEYEVWMELGKLYKTIGEDEEVMGIYEAHISKLKLTRVALSYEVSGLFDEALKIYDSATEKADRSIKKEDWKGLPPNREEIDMWESSRMECLMKLTRWEDLSKNTEAQVEQTSNLWSSEYKDPYLKYYVESNLHLKEKWPELWSFVSSATEENKKILEQEFAPELSLLYLTKQDFGRADYYIKKSLSQFLYSWSTLPVISRSAKHNKLQNLQRTYELQEYTEFITKDSNFNSDKHVRKFLKDWRHRLPSVSQDNIIVWERIVSQRIKLFSKLSDRFIEYARSNIDRTEDVVIDPDIVKNLVKVETTHLYRKMAMCARNQNNLYVSDKYLRLCLKTNKKDFDFKFFKALVNLYCIKAKRSKTPQDIADKYTKALIFVKQKDSEYNDSKDFEIYHKYKLLVSDIYSGLYEISVANPQVVKTSTSSVLQVGNTEEVSLSLMKMTLKQFTDAFDPISHQGKTLDPKTISKSYLKFSDYCLDVLKQADLKEQKSNIQINVMSSCFEAMRYGDTSAHTRFPRVLQILANSSKEVQEAFAQLCQTIEPWMLLSWSNQMMALIDREEGQYVLPLLEKIGKDYPQALYYQFKISSESFSPQATKSTAKLKAYLKHDLLEKFTDSLYLMTHPEHRFKDWCDLIKADIDTMKKKDLLKLYNEMYKDCFGLDSNKGSYNRNFISKWKANLDEKFGNEGIKLVEKDQRSILSDLAQIDGLMKKTLSSQTRSSLSEFSMWLSEFDASNFDEHIEIPGQYTDVKKPQPDLHVKISSFDHSLLVMSSIRKPKRLKIRGNNEKEYLFLVKGGEDLRLDQRIQQLFGVMNGLIKQDTLCSKRNIHIHTYDVVPMTSRVGILEWVVNTLPLKAIVENQMRIGLKKGQKEEQAIILRNDAYRVHGEWIEKYTTRGGAHLKFLSMIEYASRKEVEKVVKTQHDKVKWDLLRSGVLSLTSNAEAFISVRKNFTISLAVFSIASYIIGIGDRHLDNFLLNLVNGEVIGIDFGYSFGTATQVLPIPELVPFRLTRQFINLLKPHGIQGLLQHSMVNTLDVLRRNKEILLDTMDVFVHEPLLDWENHAKRLIKEQEGEEDSKTWIPKQKIEIARRKLCGDNPAYITIAEIRGSVLHSNRSYTKKLEEHILAPQHSIRGVTKESGLTPKEQVECLIDQATDTNLLGRAWVGWASWI